MSGRVQGVFFRASTLAEAEKLGLTGHAINLPNGDVEVLACGDADAVAALHAWLKVGPPLARVTAVSSEPRPASGSPVQGFRTG